RPPTRKLALWPASEAQRSNVPGQERRGSCDLTTPPDLAGTRCPHRDAKGQHSLKVSRCIFSKGTLGTCVPVTSLCPCRAPPTPPGVGYPSRLAFRLISRTRTFVLRAVWRIRARSGAT